MNNVDEMEITILEDGTIKIETDKVSGANHANAEAFFRAIAEQAGGTVIREARGERRRDQEVKQVQKRRHTHK